MDVTRRELWIERLLSYLDKPYSIHYQELITSVSKVIDSYLADSKEIQPQTKSAKNAIVNFSFENEFSHFFKWATNYKLYHFHLFLGYNDIEQLLLDKCTNVNWINEYEVQVTIKKAQ